MGKPLLDLGQLTIQCPVCGGMFDARLERIDFDDDPKGVGVVTYSHELTGCPWMWHWRARITHPLQAPRLSAELKLSELKNDFDVIVHHARVCTRCGEPVELRSYGESGRWSVDCSCDSILTVSCAYSMGILNGSDMDVLTNRLTGHERRRTFAKAYDEYRRRMGVLDYLEKRIEEDKDMPSPAERLRDMVSENEGSAE